MMEKRNNKQCQICGESKKLYELIPADLVRATILNLIWLLFGGWLLGLVWLAGAAIRVMGTAFATGRASDGASVLTWSRRVNTSWRRTSAIVAGSSSTTAPPPVSATSARAGLPPSAGASTASCENRAENGASPATRPAPASCSSRSRPAPSVPRQLCARLTTHVVAPPGASGSSAGSGAPGTTP